MEQRPMNKEKGKLDRCLDLIHLAMAWTAAACIIFMMLAICYSVFMRYLWDKPVPSVLEISSYLMLYITFLGTAWLQRQEGHVEVDLFLGNANQRTRAGFKAITYLGGAAVGFILAWKGSLVTIDYFRRGVTLMGILEHSSIPSDSHHSNRWLIIAGGIYTSDLAIQFSRCRKAQPFGIVPGK